MGTVTWKPAESCKAGLAVLQLIHISNNSLGAELHTPNPPLIHEALQPGPQSEMSPIAKGAALTVPQPLSVPLSAPCCSLSYSHHRDSWGGRETAKIISAHA